MNINEVFGRNSTILAGNNSDILRQDEEASDEPYTLFTYLQGTVNVGKVTKCRGQRRYRILQGSDMIIIECLVVDLFQRFDRLLLSRFPA